MGLPRGDYGPRTNAHRGEYGPGPWSTFTRGLRRAPGRKPLYVAVEVDTLRERNAALMAT